ncbi:hypothetical protein PTTG_29597 [Puccinia triticina 1-1 BBBD Race 1]|uniref:Uncharacterized protein n=1 Tax=Puccinia triticina (isolate 1-1 / race 1 (BBBD)) TaxID=630390 RepID=A0A180G5B3_PUCT1|nr:hypothetical protein PTTG_29597 [Puccinia triticina 1-1 BBBD Race 1]WAR52061.1 hypothetical protein PtB15_1B500 [Puccinia triticina]
MDDPNDSVGNCERSLGQMSFLPPVNFIPRFRPITRNPEHERIWKQGDAVIESFQRMVTKYDESADRRLENFRANHVKFTIDELTRNEATLNHLVSNLLPMLRSQIIRLLKSLNPFGLQQEPESKIRLISQNRLNVEKTIDILRAWIVKVCPGRLVKPYPSSDHHYKRSKSFRLFTLKKYIFEASLDIGRSCRVASELLHHAKCSADAHSQQTKKTYYQGLLAAKRAVGSIHAAIECIKGSELDVAEKIWQSRLTGIDYSMRIIMCLITPATNSSRRRKKFGDESVIHLSKSAITWIKVHKLFFVKFFSKRGAIRRNLPCFTELCSDQILSIVRSIEDVAEDLNGLVERLKEADRIGDYIINDSLRSSAAALKARFDAPMVLLLLYLIPLIPDIATQNDYRDWLLTWNTQRNLACENYIDISRSLIDRESDGHESDDHESDSYHSSDSYESDYRF